MNRSELREIIIKILYQVYIYKEKNIDFSVNDLIKEQLDRKNEFVENSINGVIENQDKISFIANKYMKNWDISRIDKTGAAILKMAIYELKYTDTPHIVVINEAVELAKKYSDDAVRKIINAVLDKMIKE